MATYTQMVDKVLAWSNRDTEVLPYATIKDFINFAADEAYRTLRIAPLEQTITYTAITAAQEDADLNTLAIPTDLIEFIQLRRQDENSLTDYQVYDAKPDIRSFYNEELLKYNYYYFARQQNNLVVHPNFSAGDIFELYYYRRLPETDARYSVNAANNSSNLLYFDTDRDQLISAVQAAEGSTVFSRDPDLNGAITNITPAQTGLPEGFYLGRLTPNWLRDENEKILLFGALMQAFSYLNEVETMQMYEQKFMMEIEKLNREDNMRMYKGGNITTHFVTYGQI